MSQIPELGRPLQFNGAFDVVAMAASAGGLGALRQVLEALPGDFAAALVIVQHLDPSHPSLLASILGRRARLEVTQAKVTDILRPGVVFVAPPNQHLLVNRDGSLSLTHSELVHFVRPSADLLFESVAASFQERAIAVVLSGSGSDGAMGVEAIKKKGGVVIVQDRQTSEFAGMPDAARDTGVVDYDMPLNEIAPRLVQLVQGKRVTK